MINGITNTGQHPHHALKMGGSFLVRRQETGGQDVEELDGVRRRVTKYDLYTAEYAFSSTSYTPFRT